MSDQKRISADVAIVGAGLAGLAAARAVAASGKRPVVLEARERVGGRTLNESIGGGNVVEIGGQWVGPTQKRVMALISELGLETFPTYGEGRNRFERSGRIRDYEGTIPKINPLALAEAGATLARVNRMARTIDPERPWAAPKAESWDSQTFASWIRRNLRTRTARDLMRLAIWAEPEDISLLSVLFYVRSAGSLEALIETEGGAQESRVLGGSQAISLRIAEELDDDVILGAPVRRIEHARGTVTVTSTSGVAVEAWRAIVALPPVLAGRIEYDPPMPAIRDGLTQRMAMGSVVKCMAIYPEPFWRDEGLSGQVTSADGPVSVTYDNSPKDGSPGVMLAFLVAGAARRAADLPQDERREIVLRCLERFFGSRAAEPERYLDKAWAADPWSAGCYGGFMPPGAWRANGPALRDPVGPVHWAGAETAAIWSGYMDGAISSGERAALEALESMGG